jgi:hypothetical protein
MSLIGNLLKQMLFTMENLLKLQKKILKRNGV